MRILLTNDDGIASPGLEALRGALTDHEVWTVAPDGERSGCSHSVTMGRPVVTREVGARVYSCDGLPVDCVNMALAHIMPAPPAVVVSGINLGANLGSDLLYSGTAAAARQAALRDLPSLAVSLAGSPPWHLEPAARFVAEHLARVIELCPPGSLRFLNANLPNRPGGPLAVRSARLARTSYTDEGQSFVAPGGEVYRFYGGRLVCDDDPESDLAAVRSGAIAVTLVDARPREAAALDASAFRVPGAPPAKAP